MDKRIRGKLLEQRTKALIAKLFNRKPKEKKDLMSRLKEVKEQAHKMDFLSEYNMFTNESDNYNLATKEILLTQVLMKATRFSDCMKVAQIKGMSQSDLLTITPKSNREELLKGLPTTQCALLIALTMVDEKTSSRRKMRKWENVHEIFTRTPKHSHVTPIVLRELIAVSYDKRSADKTLRKVMGDTKLVRLAFQKLISFLDPTGQSDHSEIASAFRLVGKPEYLDSIKHSISQLHIKQLKVILDTADTAESRNFLSTLIAKRLSENYQSTILAGRVTACSDAQECFGILMKSYDVESIKSFIDELQPKGYFIGCVAYKIQKEYIDSISSEILNHVDRYVSASVPAKEWIKPKLNELEDEERRNSIIEI